MLPIVLTLATVRSTVLEADAKSDPALLPTPAPALIAVTSMDASGVGGGVRGGIDEAEEKFKGKTGEVGKEMPAATAACGNGTRMGLDGAGSGVSGAGFRGARVWDAGTGVRAEI